MRWTVIALATIPVLSLALGIMLLSVCWDVIFPSPAGWFGIQTSARESFLAASPSLSPDGKKVVLAWRVPDRSTDLFVGTVGQKDWRPMGSTTAFEGWPALSTDGTKIVFASERDGIAAIFLHDLPSGTTRRLTRSERIESRAVLSPDENLVALSRFTQQHPDTWVSQAVIVHELATGREFALTDDWTNFPVAFSADSAAIYVEAGMFPEQLVRIDLKSRARTLLCSQGSDFTISPDEKTVAFVDHGAGTPFCYEIFLLSLEGGRPRQVTTLGQRVQSPRFDATGQRLIFVVEEISTNEHWLGLLDLQNGSLTTQPLP